MTWKPQYTWIAGLLIIAGAFLAFQQLRPSRHYQLSDFDSKDAPGSGRKMQRKFLNDLDRYIDKMGYPMKINSGYRTAARNAAVGGVEDSAHMTGWAADLDTTKVDRDKAIRLALKHFPGRVGIGRTFIHVDSDPTKPKNGPWYYS